MREIFFRGQKAIYGGWVYGSLAVKTDSLLGIKTYFILNQEPRKDGLLESLVSWHNVKPETVGQYTGLNDKNGRRIFEGDILAIKFFPGYVERVLWDGPPDAIAKVFWDLNAFSLDANGKLDKRYADFCDINYKETEIIGNIHDNPELLKEEEE